MSAPEPIRCLTLWQPYANCVALGAKQFETRSRATPWRGLLAIHAAKRRMTAEQRDLWRLVVARQHGAGAAFCAGLCGCVGGAVVALARVASCEVMTPELIAAQTDEEREVGDWQPGRYAWRLEDVHRLSEPLQLKGRQGMWTLPPDVAAEVLVRAGGAS